METRHPALATREGHQQFTPEHVFKVLLDDGEGLVVGLIDRAGGRSRDALQATEAALRFDRIQVIDRGAPWASFNLKCLGWGHLDLTESYCTKITAAENV